MQVVGLRSIEAGEAKQLMSSQRRVWRFAAAKPVCHDEMARTPAPMRALRDQGTLRGLPRTGSPLASRNGSNTGVKRGAGRLALGSIARLTPLGARSSLIRLIQMLFRVSERPQLDLHYRLDEPLNLVRSH